MGAVANRSNPRENLSRVGGSCVRRDWLGFIADNETLKSSREVTGWIDQPGI